MLKLNATTHITFVSQWTNERERKQPTSITGVYQSLSCWKTENAVFINSKWRTNVINNYITLTIAFDT